MTPAPKTSAEPMAAAAAKPSSKKLNPWLIVSIILAIILIVVLAIKIFGTKPADDGLTVLAPEAASDSLMDFINKIYGPQIGNATFKTVVKENGLYKVTVGIVDPQSGQPVDQDVYVTVDGKLFIPQIINIATTLEQFEAFQQAQQQQQAAPQVVEDEAAPEVAPTVEEETVTPELE